MLPTLMFAQEESKFKKNIKKYPVDKFNGHF